jgi:hypothetical protein
MSYTHALGRVAELFQKVQQLERENAALREDKERLDWLEAGGEPETYEDAPHALVWCVFGETGQRSIRAAIDAARAKEGQS